MQINTTSIAIKHKFVNLNEPYISIEIKLEAGCGGLVCPPCYFLNRVCRTKIFSRRCWSDLKFFLIIDTFFIIDFNHDVHHPSS